MNTAPVTEQAQGPSVEERAVAALFGAPKPKAAPQAPPAPEPTEAEEAPQPESVEVPEAQVDAPTGDEPIADDTFEFDNDGEKWNLPKKLEKAVQNNRDYTQKSQEIANQRRVFEAMNEQARSMQLTREFESTNAQAFQQLAAYDSVLRQPLDQSLPDNEVLKAMLQRTQWKEQRDEIARDLNLKHGRYMQEMEKAQADFREKAKEAVSKRVPNWSDEAWNAIKSHAKADGYSDVELNSISDPRHQITLWKAQQYDLNKARATKAVAEVKSVKTTPSNPMPQHVKDKLAFNKALAKAADPIQRKHIVEAKIGSLFAKK